MALTRAQKRIRIKRRIRKSINGTSIRPRLSVFRSNKQIYAQIIDDLSGRTLVSASFKEDAETSGRTLVSASSLKDDAAQKMNKMSQAQFVGKSIAEVAKKAGIEACVFDRNGYLYHGRVKALAEAAREGGLKI